MERQTTNIRLVERKDVRAMLDIYGPFIANTAVSFEMDIPHEEAFWERVQKYLKAGPWLVCEVDGQLAGYAYACLHRDRAAYQWNRELSAYIHKDFQGRRIATALYHCVIDLLKLQGVTNLLAGIVFPNEKSVKFHESIGFQLLGVYHKIGYKNGAFHDVGWFELFINKGEPQPVKDFREFYGTPVWEEIRQEGLAMIR